MGGPGLKINFESTSKKLLSPSPGDGLRCAADLRERIEIVHTAEYGNFLRLLFPVFRELLLIRLNVDSAIDSIHNRFRHVILEILNRLPNNEVLRPYVSELLRVATETLAHDNEENALTCLRIIFDLHKNFRPALESEVQAFLDIVQRVYRTLPASVTRVFLPTQHLSDTSDSIKAHASMLALDHAQLNATSSGHITENRIDHHTSRVGHGAPITHQTNIPTRGLDSFKVLTECPLIVMLLFQLYPRYIQDNIPQLTPLMIGGLSLRASCSALKEAYGKYSEFVACQVKTLSFLTYLLRGFSDLMKPYQDTISKSAIALMLSCPADAVATRKELLVATRHILATEFRCGFYAHVNVLLDEHVLVGNGRLSQQSLRPLAFSTLADLVHHVRSNLNMDQLAKVVVLFSRNLHDSALPLTVQTTSVRLLLNLVDYIFHNVDCNAEMGYPLLRCILIALVGKLETLHWLMSEYACQCNVPFPCTPIFQSLRSTSRLAASCGQADLLGDCPLLKNFNDLGRTKALKSLMLPPLHFSITCGSDYMDFATDIKILLHTILRGLKTVLWCVLRQQVSGLKGNFAIHMDKSIPTRTILRPFSQDEAKTISKFFKCGIECCQLFIDQAQLSPPEEKGLLENFAGAFTVLSGDSLRMAIGKHIPFLFSALLQAPITLIIPQLLLANTNTSAIFADLLMSYLMEHLDDLSNIQTSYDAHSECCRAHNRACLVLRLFKLVFGSISLFESNQIVLHGRVQLLIIETLHWASAVHRPIGYLLLMRSVFRSLGNQRSGTSADRRKLHLEIAALFPLIMKALRQLRRGFCKSHAIHFLILELYIAVPVDIAKMAKSIPYLLHPFVCALRFPGHDLASLSLRTFEYYLDHVEIEHISILLAERPALTDSLVDALCLHLQPAPYPCGTLAIRILGKIGGLNRQFQSTPCVYTHVQAPDSKLLFRGSCFEKLHLKLDTSAHPSLINSRNLALLCSWQHGQNVLLQHGSKVLDHEFLASKRRLKYTTLPACKLSSQSCRFLFPLNKCIDATCELIQMLLHVSRNQGRERHDLPRSIGEALLERYCIMCFQFIVSALSCLIVNDTKLDNANSNPFKNNTRDDIRSIGYANLQFQALLATVLSASADSRLSLLATPLIEGLCRLFATLFERMVMTTSDGLSWLVHDHARVDSNQHRSSSLSKYTMNQMLARALTDSRLRVQRRAVRVLYYISTCAFSRVPNEYDLLQQYDLPRNRGWLILDLTLRLCNVLHYSSLHARRGASHALHYLIPLLGNSGCLQHVSAIVITSLLGALGDDKAESSLQTVNDVVCALCLAVRISYRSRHTEKLWITSKLLSVLGSRQPARRLGAQSALIELNLVSRLPTLSPRLLHIDSVRVTTETNLRALIFTRSLKVMIGCLDAITFLLSTQPPAILFDYTLQCAILTTLDSVRQASSSLSHVAANSCKCALKRILPKSGWHTNSTSFCALLSFCSLKLAFPGLTDQKDLLHLASLRVVHAGIRTLFTKNDIKPRNDISVGHQIKIFKFLLWSLDHHLPIVLCAAGSTLRYILARNCSLKEELLNCYVNQFLHQSNQYDILPLHYITGLTRLLLLPVSQKQFTRAFIDILFVRINTCVDKSSTGFQSTFGLQRVLINEALLLLSHVQLRARPWDNHVVPLTIINRAVSNVMKIESAFLQHAHDSNTHLSRSENMKTCPLRVFRKPLAYFLSQYSSVTLTYFLDKRIMSPAHVSLFCAILHLPEAAFLLYYFASMHGIELLMEAAFRGTLDTTRAKSSFLISIRKSQREIFMNVSTTAKLSGPLFPRKVLVDVKGGGRLKFTYRKINLNSVAGGMKVTMSESRKLLCDLGNLEPLQHHGLLILHTLQSLYPILGQNGTVLRCLKILWRSKVATGGNKLKIVGAAKSYLATMLENQEAWLIVRSLVNYSKQNQSDVETLFDILAILLISGPINVTFVKRFLSLDTACNLGPKAKRSILCYFIRILIDQALSSKIKILALRFLVTPLILSMLSQDVSNQQRATQNILDNRLMTLFMRAALSVTNHTYNCHSEALRVELLKLTTVLIEHFGLQLIEHRKALIKFAWNHLKSDDSFSKQWAYVNVYVALLRTFQPEARDLVKIALDLLVPSLPSRLPSTDLIKAIKWTKKIMYEEGHALSQLTHMWQLIIRHPLLFFPYRMQFVPQMVNSLNRLGLPPNCPIENRQLAVALADTIIAWELHHHRLQHSQDEEGHAFASSLHIAPRQYDGSAAPDHSSATGLLPSMIELLVNFLVRFALFSADHKEIPVQRLAKLCIALLKVSLTRWPEVHLRFSYFEKVILASQARLSSSAGIYSSLSHDNKCCVVVSYSTSLLTTCLDVFLVTLSTGSNCFFMDNIMKIQHLLLYCFDILHPGVQRKLRQLLELITTLFPLTNSSSSTCISLFYQNLKVKVEHVLRTTISNWNFAAEVPSQIREIENPTCGNSSAMLSSLDLIFKTCEHVNYIANHGTSLMQVAQQLAVHHLLSQPQRETKLRHLSAATPIMSFLSSGILSACQESSLNDIGQMNRQEHIDQTTTGLHFCLKLIGDAVQSRTLFELRRPFVALLFGCFKGSKSIQLLSSISSYIGKWVSTAYSPFTQLEKDAFLELLGNIDWLDEIDAQPLVSQYLTTIQRLDRCSQTSLPHKFEVSDKDPCHKMWVNPVAAGLLAPHATIRAQFRYRFMKWSVDCIGTKFIGLLQADWTPLSGRFWLVVVVEVLLDSVNLSTTHLYPRTAQLSQSHGCGNHHAALPEIDNIQDSPATMICILKEVAHAHLGIAQNIFEVLSLAAGGYAIERQQGVLLQRALSHQCSNADFAASLLVPNTLPGGSCLFAILPVRTFTHGEHLMYAYDFSIHSTTNSILRPQLPKVNIPQVLFQLLMSFSMSELNPKMLFHISSKYNCRHDVITLVENKLVAACAYGFEKRSPIYLGRLLLAILEELSEYDASTGVVGAFASSKLAILGSNLSCYGLIAQAQSVYFSAMERQVLGSKNQYQNLTSSVSKSAAFALEFCENEWLRCARELAQWEVIGSVSSSTLQNRHLMWPSCHSRLLLAMDSAWKTYSWELARTMSSTKIGHCDRVWSSPQTKLQKIRLAVADRHFIQVESLCTQCISNALVVWCSLPSQIGCESHGPLLQLFHELIEVHESGQLLHEALEHSSNHSHLDIRAIVRTWRCRLPNLFENSSTWDNILRWREFCFTFIRREFSSWCPKERIALFHDSSWTAAVALRVARKHRLEDRLVIDRANAANDPIAIETIDSSTFTALRGEIISCYRRGDNNFTRLRYGLNLILNTSTRLLNLQQRSELLRLKGTILGALGLTYDAHAAFSVSTRTCHSYGRTWLAWATLCESHKSLSSTRHKLMLIRYSVACIIAAVECGNSRACVCGIARILHLIRGNDGDLDLATLLLDKLDVLPSWIWVPWAYQLIGGFVEGSPAFSSACLIRMAVAYPQALYFVLHAELGHLTKMRGILEQKEDLMFSKLEIISCHMRECQSMLTSEMNALCNELACRFQPRLYDRVYSLVAAVFAGCCDSFERLDNEPPSFIVQKLSAASESLDSASQHKTHPHYVLSRKYLEAFRRDFITSRGEYINMYTFIRRLLHWKRACKKLAFVCSSSADTLTSTAETFRMKSGVVSGKLVGLVGCALEIPGQYCCAFTRPNKEASLMLLDIGSYLVSDKCKCSTGRHIFILTTGGQKISFLAYAAQRLVSRVSENSVHLFGIIDYALTRSITAQKRRLRIVPSVMFTASSSLQFLSDPASSFTLSGVNDFRCLSLNIDSEAPRLCMRQRFVHLFLESKLQCSRKFVQSRLANFFEACRSLGTDTNTTSRYVAASISTAELYWNFRRTFAKSLGIQSLVVHVLDRGGVASHNLDFCAYKAQVQVSRFCLITPLDRRKNAQQRIPFRLTRNLLSMIQPIMIHGVFTLAIGLAALALKESSLEAVGIIEPYSYLFFESRFLRTSDNTKNHADSILQHLNKLAPAFKDLHLCLERAPMELTLSNFVESAQNPHAISLMDPSWQPWL